MTRYFAPRYLLAAYIVVGVLTFGHSAARQAVCEQADICSVGRPFFASVFWPLYWSWEAWS